MTPGVLVADEPTTALDVTMEAQIIHLLRELRTDYHGAIVVVTHHLGVVGELCDRVYVMYAGEVVEEGLRGRDLPRARHPYTRALIACDPAHFDEHTPILPTIPGRCRISCTRRPAAASPTAAPGAQAAAAKWPRPGSGFPTPNPPSATRPGHDRRFWILPASRSICPAGGLFDALLPGASAASMSSTAFAVVEAGETLGLVGESGSGKTTLARAMLGLSPISAGTIPFDGAELRTKPSFANCARAAMMFQDPVASLSPRMNVGALLTEPFIIHGVAMQTARRRPRNCWHASAFAPTLPAAIRTSCPAARRAASAWPARWRCSPSW